MALAYSALFSVILVNLFAAVSCSPWENQDLVQSRTIRERASEAFNKASTTGQANTCLMQNDVAGATQFMSHQERQVAITSPWTDYNDITTWGWRHNMNYNQPGFTTSLDAVLSSLNVGKVTWWEWRNDVMVTVDNVNYLPSGGRYADGFACSSGFIIADEIYSPESISPELKKQGLPYVKLRRWSDIAFLTYHQLCPNTQLKGVIQVGVVNGLSLEIIDEIKAQGHTVGSFSSRYTANNGDGNFNALLGTPNVYGAAWILINHKPQLGLLTMSSISLFYITDADDDDEQLLCLYTPIESYTPPNTGSQ